MSESNSGVTFTGVLTAIFIALKLAKVIDWSWWVVLLPSLISFGLVLVVVLILLIIELLKD